jgi:hypothetical protein
VVGACTSGESLSICAGCTFITRRQVTTFPRISQTITSVRSWSRLLSALDTKRSSDVTMFQRSSTYVMSVKEGVPLVFGGSLKNFYEMCMVTENLLD